MRRLLFILLILALPLRAWAGLGLEQHQHEHCTVPCQAVSASAAHSHEHSGAAVQHEDCKSDLCCVSMAMNIEVSEPVAATNPTAVPAFTPTKIVSAVIAHDVKPPIS